MQVPSNIKKGLSWLVHAFTASGLLAGFMAILAINEEEWRLATIWLIVAFFIDGVDGTFARMLDIKKTLPNVSGKMIDTVVDFVNYAVVPAYFLFMYEAFSDNLKYPAIALILIVSAIYYGKEGMIYKEMYFIGFPVLWNLIAFYIVFVINAGETVNFLVILIFAILHFIPLKFSYPSRKSRFQKIDLFIGIIFFLTMILTVYLYPEKNLLLTLNAYFCGIYFLGMAVFNTLIDES